MSEQQLDDSIESIKVFNNYVENMRFHENVLDGVIEKYLNENNVLPSNIVLRKLCEEIDQAGSYWHLQKIGYKLYLQFFLLDRGLIKDDSFDYYEDKTDKMLSLEIAYKQNIDEILYRIESRKELTLADKAAILDVSIFTYKKWCEIFL